MTRGGGCGRGALPALGRREVTLVWDLGRVGGSGTTLVPWEEARPGYLVAMGQAPSLGGCDGLRPCPAESLRLRRAQRCQDSEQASPLSARTLTRWCEPSGPIGKT